MNNRLKKTGILVAFAVLIQLMLLSTDFGMIQVQARGVIDKAYWNYKNIGQTNEYSTADILASNTVIVAGSGSGEFNTEDSFTYAYIPVQGDCTIQAKLTSESGSDLSAKAGLMIRESLDTNSKNAFLALNRNNGLTYQYRTSVGDGTANIATASASFPVYLKLKRTGNEFEAFMSTDGENWTKTGSTQTIEMGSKVYLGFASTSTNPDKLCTARFENVDVQYTDETPPSAPNNLRSVDMSYPTCYLKWDEACDDSGTALYEVYSNGNLIVRTHERSCSYSNVYSGKTIDYYVVAIDAAGNRSAASNKINIVTQNATVSSTDVKNIRLNSIGLNRLNATRQQQNKPLIEVDPAQVGEEVMTDNTPNNVNVQGTPVDLNTIYSESLPASADNSTLQCFPNIGYQMFGDCVCWSSTYYTMTHMVGLAKINAGREWDAKNDLSKVFSPKFTFPIGSSPAGGPIQGIFQMLLETGSATLADVPYVDDGVDGNKINTDLNAWENAINYRMDKCGYIDTNDANLVRIKQLLNNGYVLSFGTFISSFKEYPYPVKDNPDPSVNDDYMVGKKIYYMLDGKNGGHQMTVVGYDDNIWWGDVNGDGIPQPEEKGVFKVANSWGTNYGYDGYYYIAYDSIYGSSKFSEFNTSERRPIVENNLAWTTPKRDYNPQLVAEFTVSHAKRDQLKISVGYSDKNQTVPEAYFVPSSLNNIGYPIPFDANSAGVASDGNFAVDLTDFITKFNLDTSKEYRWYLMIGDKNEDGLPATLKSFKVHDEIHDTYAAYSGPMFQCDGNINFAYVDYGWLSDIVGDLDGNGSIGDYDYSLIIDYIGGTINDFPVEHDMWSADVDGDGSISVFDAMLIKSYILGNINIFPKH